MSEIKTPWKKVVSDPNFVGEGDFQEGEEKIVTIKSVNQSEEITTAEGKSKKVVVHFVEDVKPMIVNVARAKSIEKVSGSKYLEDWIGVKIQLYIKPGIKAFGEVVAAVRVRPFKPKEVKAVDYICTDCKKPIQGAQGKTAEWLASYTTKNYGTPLCSECAMKRKADKSQVEEGEASQ